MRRKIQPKRGARRKNERKHLGIAREKIEKELVFGADGFFNCDHGVACYQLADFLAVYQYQFYSACVSEPHGSVDAFQLQRSVDIFGRACGLRRQRTACLKKHVEIFRRKRVCTAARGIDIKLFHL